MVEYTVTCAISGDKDIFSVKINSDELVSELKHKIKLESPELGGLAANTLSLYRIDVDASNKQRAIHEVKTIAQNLRITDRLNPVSKLNMVFPSGIPGGKVHILVKIPEGESIDSTACGVIIMADSWSSA